MESSFCKSKIVFFSKIKCYYAIKLFTTSPNSVKFQKIDRDAGPERPALLPGISSYDSPLFSLTFLFVKMSLKLK